MTNRMNELLNSGVTLNAKETEEVERYLSKQAKPVKPSHLNHYLCLSASRGKGSDVQSY